MELLRVLVWPITVLLLAVLGWRFNQMSQTKRLRLAILIDEAKSHAANARAHSEHVQSNLDVVARSVNALHEGQKKVDNALVEGQARQDEQIERLSKRLEAVEAVARAAGEARQPPARRV